MLVDASSPDHLGKGSHFWIGFYEFW
jgi:hypothetical protein